ncbi:MAG: hypothetical protein CM15mV144_450 [Caudoviricetes sp.]|nr:MAG: hypothetical protein CM15mV144_450 [Caudoviricetes sp.]
MIRGKRGQLLSRIFPLGNPKKEMMARSRVCKRALVPGMPRLIWQDVEEFLNPERKKIYKTINQNSYKFGTNLKPEATSGEQ